MKFNFHSDYGYGHSIESVSLKRFAPRITFQEDDGASGGTQNIPPETDPKTQPEDVSGLKSALEKERSRAKDLERKSKQLEDSFKGIDPEKYKQFEALQAEAEKANQREAELKQSLESQYTTQIQEVQVKLQASEQKFQSLLKRTQVEKVFQSAQGRAEAAQDGLSFFDTVYTHADRYLRMNDKGDLEVLDNNGVKRFSKKDASKAMSPTELFEELKTHPVLGHCFLPANNAKGSGINRNDGRIISQEDTSNLPRSQRLTMARERGR